MTLELAGPYGRENGPCPYLPDRTWGDHFVLARGDLRIAPVGSRRVDVSAFDDPSCRLAWETEPSTFPDGLEIFERLLAAGLRRSGRIFYRPACSGCAACVSLRVDVARFAPSGDQRRALRKNRDVTLEVAEPSYSEEKHALYQRFLAARYPDHADVTRESYEAFLVESLGNTREFRYRIEGRLVGVGIVDLTRTAASSVYFYFDPAESARSLGTYSVLREIDVCRLTERAWLYLGFRVEGCAAMRYKASFRAHQLLEADGGWVDEEPTKATREDAPADAP